MILTRLAFVGRCGAATLALALGARAQSPPTMAHAPDMALFYQTAEPLLAAVNAGDADAVFPAFTNLYLLNDDLSLTLSRAGERLVAAGQEEAMPGGTASAFVDQVALYIFDANLQRMLALINAMEYYNTEGDAEFRDMTLSAFNDAMADDRRAAAALDPMLDRIAGKVLPATLLPEITTDYAVTTNTAYGVLVDVRNVGDVAAEGVIVTLAPQQEFGAPETEVPLGDIPGGGSRSHLFYLNVPDDLAVGRVMFAQVSVTSSNAIAAFSHFMMHHFGEEP